MSDYEMADQDDDLEDALEELDDAWDDLEETQLELDNLRDAYERLATRADVQASSLKYIYDARDTTQDDLDETRRELAAARQERDAAYRLNDILRRAYLWDTMFKGVRA